MGRQSRRRGAKSPRLEIEEGRCEWLRILRLTFFLHTFIRVSVCYECSVVLCNSKKSYNMTDENNSRDSFPMW
jgi:hypothetical protein